MVKQFREAEEERILSPTEEERLFDAIEELDKRGDHLKEIITIALHTGMRQGEILTLHREWINFGEGVIIVPRYNQKRKKRDKRAPINSEVKPLLESLLGRTGESG